MTDFKKLVEQAQGKSANDFWLATGRKPTDVIVELAQQIDVVVAENAAQKAVIDAVVSVANQSQGISGWHSNGAVARWEEILPEIYDIETPVTDAALAEVEARGVEKALAVISTCSENICPGGLAENRQYEESIVQPHLDGIVDELESLIAELREVRV